MQVGKPVLKQTFARHVQRHEGKFNNSLSLFSFCHDVKIVALFKKKKHINYINPFMLLNKPDISLKYIVHLNGTYLILIRKNEAENER